MNPWSIVGISDPPTILQRNGRELLFRVKKEGLPYELDGTQAICVLKASRSDADEDAVLVKRTDGYPGDDGGDDQLLYETLPPPNGGSDLLWGARVFLTATETAALEPGEYFLQLDILPTDAEQRFTAFQGVLTVSATGITGL